MYACKHAQNICFNYLFINLIQRSLCIQRFYHNLKKPISCKSQLDNINYCTLFPCLGWIFFCSMCCLLSTCLKLWSGPYFSQLYRHYSLMDFPVENPNIWKFNQMIANEEFKIGSRSQGFLARFCLSSCFWFYCNGPLYFIMSKIFY